jgi:hypothetical protein
MGGHHKTNPTAAARTILPRPARLPAFLILVYWSPSTPPDPSLRPLLPRDGKRRKPEFVNPHNSWITMYLQKARCLIIGFSSFSCVKLFVLMWSQIRVTVLGG